MIEAGEIKWLCLLLNLSEASPFLKYLNSSCDIPSYLIK